MYGTGLSRQFEHIVFPREDRRRIAINLAPSITPATKLESFGIVWPKDEADFVTWILAENGLNASHYRPETLQRRLPSCLRTIRATSLTQARRILESDRNAMSAAVSSLLVGVTAFFRDPPVFEQLRIELQRFASESKRGLYVWSIGCSEGAELYSLAMILDDLGLLKDSYLLGTDCRSDALEQARDGVYDLSQTRWVPEPFVDKYFERNEKCMKVSASLRQSIRWRVASVLDQPEAGTWDLVLFRNTAIYLRAESVRAIWSNLESIIRPGGLLVLGRAERPNGVHRLRAIGPCLYRRQPR